MICRLYRYSGPNGSYYANYLITSQNCPQLNHVIAASSSYIQCNRFGSSFTSSPTAELKDEARAVVIGGGVVGVSTLYHLVKRGWADVVLLERKELTSGSTWHAAGLLPLFNMNHTLGQLHKYSVELYKTLEQESGGMNIGFKHCTNIRLARTRDRWDEYMRYVGIAETIGVPVKILKPDQVKQLWPLCEIGDIIGAIQHPDDGYLQPAELTQALAKIARNGGAKIYTKTPVIGIEEHKDGRWVVQTEKGNILTEHVIAATGSFGRQTAKMVGLDLPVVPVQHQYLVTEPHPALVERKRQGLEEMAILRESDCSWYIREENGGFMIGPYEIGAPCCYLDGPAEDSEYELFPPDMERLMPYIEKAIARVPAFGEVGIKTVYNGAIPFTPDAIPLIGPAPGLKNYWLNEGQSFGITAAGGSGWQLAQWIVDGEPSIDMMPVDPRRFGDYAASQTYLRLKNEEAYKNIFTTHYTDEEREAGRPLKTSPCYGRLKGLGAVFGSVYGWERPNWFAQEGYIVPAQEIGSAFAQADVLLHKNYSQPFGIDICVGDKNSAPLDARIVEKWSFRRSNYFPFVGQEVLNVHRNVGLLDGTPAAKAVVQGRQAGRWLDSILAGPVPNRPGQIAFCHLLSPNTGSVQAEFMVYAMGENKFYIISSAANEQRDHDLLLKLMPTANGSAAADVHLQTVSSAWGVLVLAGPKSRQTLQQLTHANLDNAKFPWLTGQRISVGHAWAHALRTNAVGELGWELHHPMEMQNTIFDLLMEAGQQFGIKPFGIRAANSMALEKSYRTVGREFAHYFTAWESGIDQEQMQFEKGQFVGRNALDKCPIQNAKWKFVTLEVFDATDADAFGYEPVYETKNGDNRLVGRTTNGGFGWRVDKSLALAMVERELIEKGKTGGRPVELGVRILGRTHPAIVIPESPFDPGNERLKSNS